MVVLALATLAATAGGCGGKSADTPAQAPGASTAPADLADEPLPPPAFETALPEGVRAVLGQTFTGDLDQMVARRLVRVGVAANRTFNSSTRACSAARRTRWEWLSRST